MTVLVGSGRIPTAQETQVYVGLGLMAVGTLLLWYRRDLYTAYRSVVRFPDHGLVYFIVQFVGPVVLIVAGLGLIAALALS